MKKIIISLLCAGFCFIVSAQSNFTKGYIVTKKGDTSRGVLRRNTNTELSSRVEFREQENDSHSTVYTVDNLSGFGFDNDATFETLSYVDMLDSSKSKKAFARILLEGYYNLYVLSSSQTLNYLIKTKSDTTLFLFDDITTNAGTVNLLGNYRNTLAFLGRNCSIPSITFEKLHYTESDIIQLVKKINKCNNTTSVSYYHKAKKNSHLFVYAGGLTLHNRASQFTASVQMRYSIPAISRKFFYAIGIHYAKNSDYEFTRNYLRQEIKTVRTTEIISVPFVFQYAFTETFLQPYSYLGFSAAYQKTNRWSNVPNAGFQNKFGIALVGGIGFEIYPTRRFIIKADWRYELLTQYPSLGLAYKF